MSEITYGTIDSLSPDEHNARRRDLRATEALSKSLKEFGAARSIVVDGDGKVRAGNGTLEAARAAGITKTIQVDAGPDELVVVRRGDLKGEKAQAYAIADNRTGELSEWDLDELERQLKGFEAVDFDAESMGFTDQELSDILPQAFSPNVDPSQSVKDVTDEDIDKAGDELEGKYNTEHQDQEIITCPHCFKEFSIQKE